MSAIDLSNLDHFAAGPPHELYRRLRDEVPLHWNEPTSWTPDGEGFWSLTRHADVDWAAKRADLFSSSSGAGGREGGGTLIEDLPPGIAGVLLNMQDDPRHQRFRSMVMAPLGRRHLHELEADLALRSAAIVERAVAAGSCDLVADVAVELPLQAVATLLGVPQEDRHLLLGWANVILDHDDHDPGEASARVSAAGAEMYAYAVELLAHKRRHPGDDLMSAVASAELPGGNAGEGDRLTEAEQQLFFSLLSAAGSETTRNAITAGLLALMDHPGQLEAVRADRAMVGSTVEEIARWSSSTIYNRRTATAEVELRGGAIKAGDKVALWWQSANFDERAFDRPQRFDISRSPNPHLAFGLGTHFCLGANLARLEIRLVLEQVLDRVERFEVTGPIERTRSNKHAGYRRVPVRIHELSG